MREYIRDRNRLDHILESIDNAIKFTTDVSREEYMSDSMRIYAVIKNVEIIGEASYKISKELKLKHPEIEWEQIIKMRHLLVHGYYLTEATIVWDTVKNDLQPLKELIKRIYDELKQG